MKCFPAIEPSMIEPLNVTIKILPIHVSKKYIEYGILGDSISQIEHIYYFTVNYLLMLIEIAV